MPNSKTAAAVRGQAPVLVANLLALLDGQHLAAAYDGYSCCPLITGYGKAIMPGTDSACSTPAYLPATRNPITSTPCSNGR